MIGLSETEILRVLIRKASTDGLEVGEFICGYEITETNIVVLQDLVKLLLKTSFIWDETKDWLRGLRSYRVLSVQTTEKINDSTVRSRIYYDINKIKRLIGTGLAVDIFQADTEKLAELHTAIKQKIKKFDENSISKLFGIAVPESAVVSYLSESQKKELLLVCKHYSKNRIQGVESRIKPHIGYLRYLMENEASLTEEQQAELEQIKQYLL